MKINDPDILSFKNGGGCLMFFGIPFLLVGIFVMLLPFGIVPVKGDIPPWYFVIPFGSVFTMAGAILMFGRTDLTIDRRQRIIIRRWRFFITVKQKNYRLDFYRRITINKEYRSNKNSRTTVYPVRVEGETGAEVITVREFPDYHAARNSAETIAHFLGLPLSDAGKGIKVERSAETLNDSIRKQIRRSGEVIEVPELPQKMKSTIREESGTITIIIPPPGMRASSYAKLGMSLVFVAAVIIMFGNVAIERPMPPSLRLLVLAFIGIGFVLIPILSTVRQIISQTRESTRIQVSGTFLHVEKQTPYRKSRSEMPADEIEELIFSQHPRILATSFSGRDTILDEGMIHYDSKSTGGNRLLPYQRRTGNKTAAIISFLNKLTPSSGITAISDRESITFGRNLSDEELAYLHALIKKTLAS